MPVTCWSQCCSMLSKFRTQNWATLAAACDWLPAKTITWWNWCPHHRIYNVWCVMCDVWCDIWSVYNAPGPTMPVKWVGQGEHQERGGASQLPHGDHQQAGHEDAGQGHLGELGPAGHADHGEDEDQRSDSLTPRQLQTARTQPGSHQHRGHRRRCDI